MTSTTTAPSLGSILLGSTDPGALRTWYRRVLAPDHTGDGPIALGAVLLVIDERSDIDTRNAQPGRVIINFHVDDMDSIEARLRDADVEWVTPIEARPNGRFGTFVDPDGNYLQVIQFNDHP